ncbi:hypothetical protein [Kineosporia babensis]|uniref:Uncharacterized protein n=1 Tax=Kineosporia babensis TaxID=499548 RepID=A0A9X1SY54_9ACTN|nr:hypothetical protein [Kineosporia babensis]MCD5315955.1 hypothetical protein [Kineosporia babensis]
MCMQRERIEVSDQQSRRDRDLQRHGERRIVRALMQCRFGHENHPEFCVAVDWLLDSGLDQATVAEAIYRADSLPDVALIMEAVRSGVQFSVAEIADFCREDFVEASAWIFTALLLHRFGPLPGIPEIADQLVELQAGELAVIHAIHRESSPHGALEAVRRTSTRTV